MDDALVSKLISLMAISISALSLFMAYISFKDRRALSRGTIMQNRLLDILPHVVDAEYKTDKLSLLKHEQNIRALLRTVPYSFIPKNALIRQRFSLGHPIANLYSDYEVGEDPRWLILRDCNNPNHTHPKKKKSGVEDYLADMAHCVVKDTQGELRSLQDIMLSELRDAFNNGLPSDARFIDRFKSSDDGTPRRLFQRQKKV